MSCHDPLQKIQKFLDYKDFRKEAPKLSRSIDYLSEKQIESSRSLSAYIVFVILYLHVVSETIDKVLDAEKILKELQTCSAPFKRNVESKIQKILGCLENMYCNTNELFSKMPQQTEGTPFDTFCADEEQFFDDGEFFKQNKWFGEITQNEGFQNAQEKVRNALKEYSEELEKLYKELLDLKVYYIGEREEKRFITGFQEFIAGTILLGAVTGVVLKSSEIGAIPTAGLAVAGAATTLAVGAAWNIHHTDQNNNNDQDVISRLGKARSNVLEAKIVVQRFLTDLELLDIVGKYDKKSLERVLRNVTKNGISP